VIAPLLAVLLAAAAAPATREIVFDVTVDKTQAEVFALWTTPEGVRKFFAPVSVIEPRVGGRYQIVFEPKTDSEGRKHGSFGVSILEFVPNRRFVTEWTFPPFGPEYNVKPFPTRVEIDFEPASEGRTRLRLAHRGFPGDPAWDKPLATFRDVIWPYVLNSLVAYGRDGVSPAWEKAQSDVVAPAVHKDVLVEAPPSEVWAAWTTDAGIRSFLGADSRIEARVDGPYEIYFSSDAKPGERGSEGCRVLAVTPERRLTFEWNAPPTIPTIRPKHHVVQVSLESEGSGTRVRLDALGYGAGPEWAKTRDYFDKAWGSVLDALATHFAAAPVKG
jgi:uncharacterized protein YndB with AHSA1/START domain